MSVNTGVELALRWVVAKMNAGGRTLHGQTLPPAGPRKTKTRNEIFGPWKRSYLRSPEDLSLHYTDGR